MSTQQAVAEHLDLSSRWVRTLVRDGILPPSKGHGGYDLDACRVSYIRYLRGLGTGQISSPVNSEEDTGDQDGDFARLLDKERYREKKRQNDIEEKKVAEVQLLTDALVKAGNVIIPILENLPLIMKRSWPETTGDQITMVKKAIAECRNAIADSEIDFE